jgi:hypothetical protein
LQLMRVLQEARVAAKAESAGMAKTKKAGPVN